MTPTRDDPISPSVPWDFFHVNSISLDPSNDGNFLISSRNTWAGYEIDGHTGQILWRLGGKRSSFHMGAGTGTAWQHDMRWQPDGTITLFDDGACRHGHSQSRAIHERIDWRHRTVHLVGRDDAHTRTLDGQPGQRPGAAGRRLVRGLGRTPLFHRIQRLGSDAVRSEHPLSGPVIPRIHLPLDGDARKPTGDWRSHRRLPKRAWSTRAGTALRA